MATTFNLYWSLTSPVTLLSNQIPNVASPYDHTGLPSNVKYYYALTITVGTDTSSLGNELSGLTLPDAPNFNAVGYAGYNKLTWSYMGVGLSYNIYWSETPIVTKSSNKISIITGLSYNHTANTLIYYAMSTVNATGESDLSSVKQAQPIGFANISFASNGTATMNRIGLARKRNLTDMGGLVVLLKLRELTNIIDMQEYEQIAQVQTQIQAQSSIQKTVDSSKVKDAVLGIGGALALAVVVGSQLGEIEEK